MQSGILLKVVVLGGGRAGSVVQGRSKEGSPRAELVVLQAHNQTHYRNDSCRLDALEALEAQQGDQGARQGLGLDWG